MSDWPRLEDMQQGNSPQAIKLRTAGALIRFIQTLTPDIDAARILVQEVQDIVAVYGTVTDADLEPLGISAATITNLSIFATNLVAFADSTPAGTGQKPYRVSINAVRRMNA